MAQQTFGQVMQFSSNKLIMLLLLVSGASFERHCWEIINTSLKEFPFGKEKGAKTKPPRLILVFFNGHLAVDCVINSFLFIILLTLHKTTLLGFYFIICYFFFLFHTDFFLNLQEFSEEPSLFILTPVIHN
jgi:hypothetical protein